MSVELEVAWIAAVSALGGTLLGGVITIGGQWWQSNRDRASARKTFARTLAAELEAFAHFVEKAELRATFEKAIQNHRNGSTGNLSGVVKEGHVVWEMPTYTAKAGEVGDLGNAAEPLVIFFSKLTALRAGVRKYETGGYANLPAPEIAVLVAEFLVEMTELTNEARALSERLRRSS